MEAAISSMMLALTGNVDNEAMQGRTRMSADETRGELMTKEQLTKEDGRYVFLYTFASDSPEIDSATPDAQTHDPKAVVPRV